MEHSTPDKHNADEKKRDYNAIFVSARGRIKKIKIDVSDYAACAEAVDAHGTDIILGGLITLSDRLGFDFCGFCDRNGYNTDKPENAVIARMSGYDVIIGDVVLCGCVKYEYAPLKSFDVDKLFDYLKNTFGCYE